MVLTYKFKKEELKNGGYIMRPRILVELIGSESSIVVPALIDSGCDITVIPEGMARGIGLDMKGKKDKLHAFRESNDAIHSKAEIKFLGKEHRQAVYLKNIPSLIVMKEKDSDEEDDITLGVEGIFDFFDISFKKRQNKIILKQSAENRLVRQS